jgi:hypothetical protein
MPVAAVAAVAAVAIIYSEPITQGDNGRVYIRSVSYAISKGQNRAVMPINFETFYV